MTDRISPGMTFGKWTVIELHSRNPQKWTCECECGTVRPVLFTSLIKNQSLSCGCINGGSIKNTISINGNVAEIEIIQNEKIYKAIIDTEDLVKVKDFKFCLNRGYVCTSNEKKLRLHNLIIDNCGYPEIDHKNRNKLDNRKCNLRPCTKSQNQGNRKPNKNNTSGYRGVTFKCNNWAATIVINGIKTHLGYFGTKEGAAIAYNKAARKHWGSFANLNNVEEEKIEQLDLFEDEEAEQSK
jgi:hypothetical protein